MTFSIAEQVELSNIIRDLDEIARVCSAFVDKNPLQLSEQVAIASAVRNKAQETRDALKAAIDLYNQEQNGPFPSSQALFNLQRNINRLILTDYNTQVLPKFQELTESILNKENDIKNIAAQKRDTGSGGTLSPEEIDDAISKAKDEVALAKQVMTTQGTFDSVSSFASKARPYVEKIVKAAKIAFTVIGLFV